jgi:membrane-associated phospholipid phosphatase
MFGKLIAFILRRRLEDVMAVGVSLGLVIVSGITEIYHAFQFKALDFAFILLPVGILGVKYLLELLVAGEDATNAQGGPLQMLGAFFRPLVEIFRDWFPFVLLSASYYSLYSNLIFRIKPQTDDAILAKIDTFLVGTQPSFLLEPLVSPGLTDFLSLVYFSYVLSLPAVAFYFYIADKKSVFRRVMMGYLTLMMMGYLTLMMMGLASYLLVPAMGPQTYFSDHYTRDLLGRQFSKSVEYIINVGRVGFDCFPSLHVGIPFLLSLYLRDYRRKLFLPSLAYVLLIAFATIYLRYHYLIDVLAAFVYAPVAYWLNDFLLAKWPGEKILAKTGSVAKNPSPE